MRLTLHIGSHKAGSTAIQKFCAISPNALAEKSVLYPTGLFQRYPEQHSELAGLLRPDASAALADVLSEVAKRSKAAGRQHVFLSGEDLCAATTDASLERLRAAAARHFSEIVIVIVLRAKLDYLMSHYNFFLRHAPESVGMAEFRQSIVFNPLETVALWGRVFGPGNVRIIPYDAADGRTLLVRFFGELFSVKPSAEALAKCTGVNSSFDMISAFLFNDVLKAVPSVDRDMVNRAYMEAFGKVTHHLPFLEADLATYLDSAWPDEEWSVAPENKRRSAVAIGESAAKAYLTGLARFVDHLQQLSSASSADGGAGAAGPRPTRQQIIDAYRILLDREPENEVVIKRAGGYKTVAALRSAILSSTEYRRKNPGREKLNVVPMDAPVLPIRTSVDPRTLQLMLSHIGERWTALGEAKPHWSVLSAQQYEGKMTRASENDFYATGVAERTMVERVLGRAGRRPSEFQRVLEFGCGLGRLTLQFAEMFAHVVACDVSASHLRLAREAAERRRQTNIDFRLVTLDTFAMPDGFDFWYSRIVLQHNPPPLIEAILRQALRQLEPNGIAIFQVPTYAVGYTFNTDEYVAAMNDKPEIEMHCIPQRVVFAIAAATGCRIVEVREDNAVDIPHYWVSNTFVLEKEGKAPGPGLGA